MKKLLIIALTIIGLNIHAQEVKTYAVKSGYIKYELGGSTTGTRELWWDDYGGKTCETVESTTTTKIFGIKNTDEIHSTTVIVKDKFWVADYIDDNGSNGTVPFYKEGQEYFGEMSEKEQQEFADDLIASMGGEKLGTESVKGYKCDVIKLLGFKSWIYNGIALKTEGKLMGIETKEIIVEFKPKTRVSSSKFNPPSGVSYENLAEQAGAEGFMGALSALGDFEDMEEEEDDYDITPVDYSFEKFSKIVKGCEIEGYRCVRVHSVDGSHAAIFMKGLNTIAVMAQSDENMEQDDEFDAYQSFRQNGHTCHYGVMEEDNGSALVVEYSSDDMIVSFMAIPQKSKAEMLKIEDKMQF